MKKLLVLFYMIMSFNALADNELILPDAVLGSAAPGTGQVTLQADPDGGGTLLVLDSSGNEIVVSKSVYSLHAQAEQNGSGALVEQNLGNYSMPALTLRESGDGVKFRAAGNFPTASTDKRIRLHVGTAIVLDTASMTAVPGAWNLEGHCIRVSSSVSKCGAALWTSYSSYPAFASYAQVSDSLESTLNIRVRGNGTTAGDVLGQLFEVLFKP